MIHHALLHATFRCRHIPTLRRGLEQHRPRQRPHFPVTHPFRRRRRAPARHLHSKHRMVVDRVHRRRFHAHFRPIRLQLFIQQHCQRSVDALPHLRVRRNHRDAFVRANAHERVHREFISFRRQNCFRFSRPQPAHTNSPAIRRLTPPRCAEIAAAPLRSNRCRYQLRGYIYFEPFTSMACSAWIWGVTTSGALMIFSAPRPTAPRDEWLCEFADMFRSGKYSAHRFVNFRISRLQGLRQKHRRAHNLPRLAVTALRDVHFNPRLLQRMRQIRRESLDGSHVLAVHPRHRRNARSNRFPLEMHGASPAV